MTAPVFSQTKNNQTTMMFYMPSYFTSLQELAKPNNRRVKLGFFDLGKVAVARFSGYNNYEKQQQVFEKLVKWAKSKMYNSEKIITFQQAMIHLGFQRTKELMKSLLELSKPFKEY